LSLPPDPSAALDPKAVLERAALLHSVHDVQRAVERMAAEIAARLADANPVVLAVMHGGVFAAVELCKRFRFPHEFDYVHLTRYGGGTRGGEIEWRVRPSPRLEGRTVLVVDDILDRGHTLQALHAELDALQVSARYTAALVVKRVTDAGPRPRVDFAGLTIDDVYVFGCGMDYHGQWRGLPALYALPAPDPRA
jgi:hypoxanthine phosphoribosyltransferase